MLDLHLSLEAERRDRERHLSDAERHTEIQAGHVLLRQVQICSFINFYECLPACAYMYMYHVCFCLWRPEEDVRSPGFGIIYRQW